MNQASTNEIDGVLSEEEREAIGELACEAVLERLRTDPEYRRRFKAALMETETR